MQKIRQYFGWRAALIFLPILGNLAAIFTLISVVLASKRRQQHSKPAFFVFCFVSCFFGYHILRGAFVGLDDQLLSSIMRSLPVWVITFLAIFIYFPRLKDIRELAPWSAITLVIIILIEHQVFGNNRAELLTGNPLLLAAATCPLMVINLDLAFRSDGVKGIIAYVGFFCAFLVTTYFTAARGVSLTAVILIVTQVIFLFFQPKRLKQQLRQMRIVAPAIVLAIIIISFTAPFHVRLMGLFDLAKDFLADGTLNNALDQSTQRRFAMFSAAQQAIENSPVFGYGIQNRFQAILPYYSKDAFSGFTHLHNTYLTNAVGGGIVAVALLVSVLISPIVAWLIKERRITSDMQAPFLIMLSIVLNGFTNLVVFESFAAILLGLSLVCCTPSNFEK